RTVVLLLEADQGSAFTLKQDVEGLDVGADREVRPTHRRTQEGRSRAAPLSVPLGNLVDPKTLLVLAIEVGIALEPGLLRSFDEGMRKLVGASQFGDAQRAARAVVVRGATLLVFRLFKVRKDVRVSPALISQVPPLIVVKMVAANVDHGVEGAASTQHLAAWPIEIPVIELAFRLGIVRPVARPLKKLGEGCRHADLFFAVGATGLE